MEHKLMNELGIDVYQHTRDPAIGPEQIRTAFDEYINFCRIVGASAPYNTLDYLFNFLYDTSKRQDDRYGLVEHITKDQLKEYLFLSFLSNQGNGRGVNSTKSEILRKELDRYSSVRFDVNDNLLFLLVDGVNTIHDAPEGFVPALFDKELQRKYSEDMAALANIYAKILLEYISAFKQWGTSGDYVTSRFGNRLEQIRKVY